MLKEDKFFQTLTDEALWQRYCGFLDLSVHEFMDTQKELLMDEIERVADSTLGKKVMGNRKPASVEEFRRIVPLTTYEDYEPYLSQQQEDALAVKPQLWCHTAGRGGKFKWIPFNAEFTDRMVKNAIACLLLATTDRRGKVTTGPGFRLLVLTPPPPYSSGSLFKLLSENLSLRRIPDPEAIANMEFQDSIRLGFQEALETGVDVIFAIASVLVRIGEQFTAQTSGRKSPPGKLRLGVVLRLIRAWLRSKTQRRGILPRDLWPTRGIATGGLDTAIYTDDIAYYWGTHPYEVYACTEAFVLAAQGWNRKGLMFLPDVVFFEFIPYEEPRQDRDNGKDSQPSTVLMDELEEGRLYEVVITQFYGLPLLRYRMNDVVKVAALRDSETGVELPQIVFQRRADEAIYLAGLCQLDEKTLWQAIASTGVRCADWTATKEYDHNQGFLRLYLELKEDRQAAEIARMVDEQLKLIDTDYKDIDAYLKLQPLRVTLLSPGTFQRYTEEKRREGADLAHLKPIHINARQEVINLLLQFSEGDRV